MKEIILEKRYPHSREEDITDAFMRGYEIGKEQEHRWWSAFCANCKTEPTISKMEQVDEPQADCGDFADRLAYERGVKHAWKVAQKVFDSTVTFYEAEDVAKQIDKDINVRSKDESQTDCPKTCPSIDICTKDDTDCAWK